MSDITLSKAVRSNLLSLQSTAAQMGKTQERLATGLKVNSALDNPTNFFTASSLNSRASDLSQLLDSVSNAVQTIAAADKGLTAITKLVESAQATARQALQTSATIDQTSVSAQATTTGSVAIADDVGGTEATADLTALNATGGTITVNGEDVTLAASDGYAEALSAFQGAAAAGGFSVTGDGDTITIVSDDGADLAIGGDSTTLTELGLTAGTTAATNSTIGALSGTLTVGSNTLTFGSGNIETRADLDTALSGLSGGITGEIDGSDNLTFTGSGGSSFTVGGTIDASAAFGVTEQAYTATSTTTAIANPKRDELRVQYNDLLDQIDQLAKDSGFNGVNLLDGDSLSVLFNEDGSSSLDVTGVTFDSAGIGLTALASGDFDDNADINSTLDGLKSAIGDLRSQSAKFGSNLSVVETRQDFTKNMINVLETGAANLTLADTNEEAANLLALQTRQQLSSTALSLASQADQNVLRLF